MEGGKDSRWEGTQLGYKKGKNSEGGDTNTTMVFVVPRFWQWAGGSISQIVLPTIVGLVVGSTAFLFNHADQGGSMSAYERTDIRTGFRDFGIRIPEPQKGWVTTSGLHGSHTAQDFYQNGIHK